MSQVDDEIKELAGFIDQLGSQRVAEIIHALWNSETSGGNLATAYGQIENEAALAGEPATQAVGFKYLSVNIPEGATHYQDERTSRDGGMRFFKRTGEGENCLFYVWAISTGGQLRWIGYDRDLLRGAALIALPA